MDRKDLWSRHETLRKIKTCNFNRAGAYPSAACGQTGSSFGKILYRNIYYIVKDHKYIILYYRGGVIKERKTLQEVYQELDAEEFFYIDKGCIVNISHVCSCDRERVCLTGGTELHISRSKYEMVRQKVLTYWGKVK